MQARRLPVVLLWHLHQPQYRDPESGSYVLPWTYLHAIKDYVDMAAHLEAEPRARAVVNFAPILIEQVEDLAAATAAHLAQGTTLPDPVLAVLADAPLPAAPGRRAALLRACLRSHPEHLIARHAPYARLAALAAPLANDDSATYASDQLLRDLGVWFHLAWLGETVRRSDARVALLAQQEAGYSAAQRRTLLSIVGELLAGILPRYRALAEAGRIELSMSPYAHPILPLLLDFSSARESMPGAALPEATRYPGGAERAAWHLDAGIAVFERAFGRRPVGCWPSEGALSEGVLPLLAARGFRWAASGGAVLHGCLRGAGGAPEGPDAGAAPPEAAFWRGGDGEPALLFRHDGLSDLVGFTYSKWHGDDAVRNFVSELEAQARACEGRDDAVLLVALDGENAWEHYPYNGYYFLSGLYAALAGHERLELATPAALLARGTGARQLPRVVAGSWVHGTLATWIGEPDKNTAWNLLVDAKRAVDAALAEPHVEAERRRCIERQLALCESSDWFWWFGDYNPEEAVREFDQLYRHQLASLYRLLGREVPAALADVISVGRGAPEGGGVMRRAQE